MDGALSSKGRWAGLLCLVAGVMSPGVASASFFEEYMIDPQDGMLDGSRYLSEVPGGFLPVPVLITEPAVGMGLGLAGVFFHESSEQSASKASGGHPVLPENISVVGVGGTRNGTKGAGLGHMGFWFDDSLRYRGFVLYGDANLDFYSLAEQQLNRPVELNIKGPAVIQELKTRLWGSDWFLGGRQVYRKVETTLESQITLPNQEFSDRVNAFLQNQLGRESVTSGLGLLAEYDSRDNPLDPRSGYNHQFHYITFDYVIGSDVDYDSYQWVGLNYWSLSDTFNLGVRLQYDGVSADEGEVLPSYVAPSIDLRGVPMNRYQGRAVAVAEVELTWRFTPRWSTNVFTGGGRAADSFGDLHDDAELANSVGLGFRYLIARRYGLRMGADIARGPEDTAFYIQAGASW
ncbi:BamA/TamA family outer membrane protein [Marinobacter sp. 1_MG-2023]|uniref:BamA/TamA family outer membrane protein n=1 Tax=Marinobacter sp. 1_MG-2023 TaxID=3062627 RepID=UPI0026E2D99C|nr:BamA/TamA family outer membrane protein [Marinobacter sp. 1_MG-2023]MDO6824763.1 BamA/TamA family outer membrane protein [Marinobacter sp. 1_MG-2023]